MIQVDYLIQFPGTVPLADAESAASFSPLDQGELTLLGLTILSDTTTWEVGPQLIRRRVQFTETPAFMERVGLPFLPGTEPTDSKRKAFVKNLFSLKIQYRSKMQLTEQITLF